LAPPFPLPLPLREWAVEATGATEVRTGSLAPFLGELAETTAERGVTEAERGDCLLRENAPVRGGVAKRAPLPL